MKNGASNNRSVLIVGGPDSGKSNYLFRLWLAISKGQGILKEDGLPDQFEYLKDGSQELLSGRFAQHTSQEVIAENEIPFQATDESGAIHRGLLVVPDCHGEKWMQIFRKREWSQQWEDRISDRSGFLIFVRASSDQIVTPLNWIQCEKLWGGPLPANADDEVPHATQVVITDLIQFIQAAVTMKSRRPVRPRIAIAVAGWDSVPKDRQSLGPSEYIRQEFPLLAQFIETNSESTDFTAFGISVAGGDFEHEPGFRAAALKQSDPVSKGYVLHELSGRPTADPDMTLPVAWAMGLVRKTGDSAA